jgi:hypothetical protein
MESNIVDSSPDQKQLTQQLHQHPIPINIDIARSLDKVKDYVSIVEKESTSQLRFKSKENNKKTFAYFTNQGMSSQRYEMPSFNTKPKINKDGLIGQNTVNNLAQSEVNSPANKNNFKIGFNPPLARKNEFSV